MNIQKLLKTTLILALPHLCFSQFTEQWHQTYNGKGDYSDRFTCITTDDQGSVYVGGSSSNPNSNTDFLVSKYAADGSVAWRRIYAGTGNGPDEANAITFANDQVYVTGYLNNAGVGNDFFTIVLSASGDSIWGANYNDVVFNQYEQANDIAVDGNGNVIVCGESDRDPSNITNDDYLTIKYSPLGAFVWAQRFNDIGNATDRAVALVANSTGDVFVTGRSDNGNDDDYATIKYNASGVQQWSQFLDNGGNDRATDMGIDDAGNIYVTGRSNNGNDDDFRTVKYSASGLEIYNVAFDNVEDDRGDAIDVAGDGSCVVAGRSDGSATTLLNYNYRVVKYNSNGIQQWTSFFDGSASNDDIVKDVFLDSDGSVAVTGYSDDNNGVFIQNNIVTIKYNASGTALWTKIYSGTAGFEDGGNACLIDTFGNMCIAGQSENSNRQRDALLLKYNSSGDEILDVFFDGIGDNGDNVRDIYVDNSNNVFIAGYSVDKDADRNMFVCKLNSAGDTLWTNHLNGTMFGSDEEANAIAVDNAGNVIISGYTKNAGSSSDITLAKFNSAGILQWTTYYNGTMNESDRAFDMVLDASGNIYITGKTDVDISPIITNDQVFTAKYLSNGTMAWSQIYNGGPGVDRGRFIRVAASGNVYVMGKTYNGTNDDFLVLKYNSSGQQQWVQVLDVMGGNDDPRDAEIDASENVYITGSSETGFNTGTHDLSTLAFNSSGINLFSSQYNGSANGIDVAEGIEVDDNGNSYIVGYTDNDASEAISNDCISVKYDNTGNQQWQHAYNGSLNLDDEGDDIALDAAGNVVVICHSNVGSALDPNNDLVTFSLNPLNGIQQEMTSFSISDSINVGNVVLVKNEDVYIGGSTWIENNQRDILVLKYALNVGISEFSVSNRLIAYPNPFDESITIKNSFKTGQGYVTITDITGSIVHQERFTGPLITLELKNLSSGIYNCIISDQYQTLSKKIIKK